MPWSSYLRYDVLQRHFLSKVGDSASTIVRRPARHQPISLTFFLAPTMADLHDQAFAAVDSFFGGTTATNEPKQAAAPSRLRRGGIGSAAPTRRTQQEDQILKIGQKRAREAESEVESSDEEEDLGRTALAPEPVKKPAVEQKEEPLTVHKKKKKGKKERAREKAAEMDEAIDATAAAPRDADPVTAEEPTEQQPKKRPFRRGKKKRSKQKNIAKDRRAVKPTHLIPGHADYQGRHLTPETRRKLNLPPEEEGVE